MRESNDTQGAALAVALVLVVVLLMMGAGATVFMWQRQHTMLLQAEAIAQRERAEAARAKAISEQKLAAVRSTGDSSAAAAADASFDADERRAIESGIQNVLDAQQQAWNAGDIDGFMKHYWNSELLTFSSGGETTRTWMGTLNRYREKYPSRGEMGELSFENLEITPLDRDAAYVLGEWQLAREADPVSGNFTLVFRRIGEQWVIVHDHTSRAEK